MLALNLIEAGAPIYGIGIQSHIEHVGPSIHVMKIDLQFYSSIKVLKTSTIAVNCCLI